MSLLGRFPQSLLGWLLILTALCLLQPLAYAEVVSSQEQAYRDAVKAWQKKDLRRYRYLKARLKDYVLYPYLEFNEVRAELGDPKKVQAFRREYPDTPMAERLEWMRLKHLGKNKRWREYYREYEQSSSKVLQCYYLQSIAAIKGKGQDWLDDVEDIWMTGTTLPRECSPLFNAFYDTGAVTSAMLLGRIKLAFQKKNVSLARFLAKKLDAKNKAWYDLWLKMHQKPLPTLMSALKMKDSEPLEQAVMHGVVRYGAEDTYLAWRLWQGTIKPSFDFSQEQIDEVEGQLVLRAGWRHLSEANAMFAEVADSALNEEARQWRVRSALRAQDWPSVITYLNKLPKDEREEQQWKYWRARAYFETGSNVRAKGVYEELAGHTSYYGFLAAEQLNQSYQFTTVPVIEEDEEGRVTRLEKRPGMLRAKELFLIGENTDAMREWNYQLKALTQDEKRWAAKLAQRWGWHFAAILTASKADHLKDLELRFPIIYLDEIQKAASENGVPDSWVYGVVRRESAFKESAVSPAGALGLMQLMPATARQVAKKLGLPKHSKQQIKEPSRNIQLGTSYLKQVQDQYQGHEVLATASYNAGPHRVKRWLPEDSELPADIWVDTITFDETRNYVKAVMFYSTIFEWKTEGRVRPLGERMWPVRPNADEAVGN